MATERELRQRIQQLQNQINALQNQQNNLHNDMLRQIDEKTKQLKRQYEASLRRKLNETEESYSRRIREFQEQITEQTKKEYIELQRQAEEISRKQKEKIKELQECNEELRECLKRIKKNTEVKDAAHRAAAIDITNEIKSSKTRVSNTPHEFFFSGEFEIINSHAVQINEEIDKGMYQAAVADAGSVIMEFDLLHTKVNQAYSEWLLAFRDYSRIINELMHRIDILEAHNLKTEAGTFILSEAELNFWSSGTYLPFKEKVRNSVKTINEIEKTGITNYLKTASNEKRKAIFSKVTEAHKWSDELSAITNCILCERMLSDERWVCAQLVSQMLLKLGYSEKLKKFRIPDALLLETDWYPKGKKFSQNPLDCFDLIETIQGEDNLQIIFVPVRENGVAVRNECIVTLFAKTLRDSELIADIINTTIRRIQSLNKPIRVVGLTESENTQRLKTEEQKRKKQPDPQGQIRFIEKKYH